MMNAIKGFLREEDGLGTVELVVIIAVLVGVALIFRTQIFSFVDQILDKVFKGSEGVVKPPDSNQLGTKTVN